MNAHVDPSIFSSPTDSFGMASGDVAFELLPRVGEVVSFAHPIGDPTATIPELPGFSFQLKVERVIHAPLGGSFSVILMLEDVVLQGVEQSLALAEYMERGFGLDVDRF